MRKFTIADGRRELKASSAAVSVISDSAGRIWFSVNRGISVVDPARLNSNSAPAIAPIQMLSVEGKAIDLNGPVHIPGGAKRLTIDYAGLSLSVPERVRFCYMLEGFENDWSCPVDGEETVYTNLCARDDGSGIDPKIIETGRDGHWGLSGMRERADRIGGRLHVFSRESGGTEVELAVPGNLAFRHQSSYRQKWFGFGNHSRPNNRARKPESEG